MCIHIIFILSAPHFGHLAVGDGLGILHGLVFAFLQVTAGSGRKLGDARNPMNTGLADILTTTFVVTITSIYYDYDPYSCRIPITGP